MNSQEVEQSLVLAEHYFRNNNYKFAEGILNKITQFDKLNPKANELLAYIYGNQGQTTLSFDLLNIASKHPNCSPEALYYLGSALLQRQDFISAAKTLELSLKKAGDFFEGLHDLGTSYAQLNKKEMALACYKRALTFRNDSYELFFNMGRLCDDLELHEDAIDYYNKSLKINPLYIKSHLNKGISLNSLKKYIDALTCFDEVIRIDPSYAQAWCNKGSTLNHLHHYEDAIMHFDKAIKISPHYVEALSNKGQALSELGHYSLALSFFNQALRINPSHRETITNKCLLNLTLKNFSEAWEDYSARPTSTITDLTPCTRWDGTSECNHLLLINEQGIGDEIFYISLLSLIKGKAQKISLMTDKRLIPILNRTHREICFFDKKSSIKDIDFDQYVLIGDIPKILGLDIELIQKRQVPFLKTNELLNQQLRKNKLTNNEFLCGLSWKSANQKIGENKSLSLLKLENVLRNQDCAFVNLQYGEVSKEITEVKSQLGVEINQVDGVDLFEDIDGLLSIIDACDIVVTTSNVTAHLAGAIGKKTLLLVPYAQGRIWYWHDDEVSIWYPSIKQYFQDADLSWDNAINKIAAELEQEIARKN